MSSVTAETHFEVRDDGEVVLLGSSCGACARPSFPRAAVCCWCGAGDPEALDLSPTGTLWGWAIVHTAPPGYDGPVPYGMGVVELPEGLRVISRIDIADPDALTFGRAVRFAVEDVGEPGDDEPFPTWTAVPC